MGERYCHCAAFLHSQTDLQREKCTQNIVNTHTHTHTHTHTIYIYLNQLSLPQASPQKSGDPSSHLLAYSDTKTCCMKNKKANRNQNTYFYNLCKTKKVLSYRLTAGGIECSKHECMQMVYQPGVVVGS